MIIRTAKCDVCLNTYTEKSPAGTEGDGFPGWGEITGLINPHTKQFKTMLCLDCLIKVSNLLKKISEGDK